MSTDPSPSHKTLALAADLSAGLVVFLVALPLCLGIALASNAPLFSGIVAGIVGGLVVGALSGSHTSVSGPAAGLTAVVATQLAELGSFETFLLALIFAGSLQIGLGMLGAGSIADFVPSSVIKGLLGAIGLILILKQIPHLFGYDADPEGEMAFHQPDHANTFSELADLVLQSHVHLGAAAIGLLCLALLALWERSKRLKQSPLPGPLVVVLTGVVANQLLRGIGGDWEVGESHLVQVPIADSLAAFAGFLRLPDFSGIANPAVYFSAVTIALVASLETLLNLEAVDKLDPQKRVSPPNRELIAQGAGNMVAGLIGGLPITSVIVRSSVNINAGAQSKRAALFHGALLLLCVALLPAWLNLIPLSALAAVLLVTGYKLANPKLFRQMWDAGIEQFLPFVVTIGAILVTDLLVGILIGLGFSILFILRSNLRRPISRALEKRIHEDVLRIELANQVSFLNRVALRAAMEEAPRGGHVLIDARATDYIDADVLSVIREFENETAPVRNIQVSLLGFKAHYRQIEDRVRYVDFATHELQQSMTPDQVLHLLREGNERFRSGRVLTRDLTRLRESAAGGRHPLAAVLSGSSSRTPVELIFDVGLGEIFCVRTTGSLAGPSALGSLEYACAIAGAKVIVVLGHTDNKAVHLALDALPTSKRSSDIDQCVNLDGILGSIQEVVTAEQRAAWPSATPDQRLQIVDTVSRACVPQTVEHIVQRSPALARLVQTGKIKIVGAIYDIGSGLVELLEPPRGLQEGRVLRTEPGSGIEPQRRAGTM